tara:strand:+ start:202 stop:897 length:696 start_codon:yes stop_codon:yes gene_type:complete
MMTPLIREWVKVYAESGGDPADGFWFDISGALHQADVPALELTLEHARPPFQSCYFVCSGKKDHRQHEVLVTVDGDDPEDGIQVSAGVKVGSGNPNTLGYFTYAVQDGKIVLLSNDMPSEQNVQMVMRMLALWYGALAQGGEAYQPVVKEGLTSKRLQVKGKAPLFSWHTVKIEPPKPKQEHRGGTHATPRLHDRRGHLRRLANGKTCWVRACKVGDASKGVVFKDYEVKG